MPKQGVLGTTKCYCNLGQFEDITVNIITKNVDIFLTASFRALEKELESKFKKKTKKPRRRRKKKKRKPKRKNGKKKKKKSKKRKRKRKKGFRSTKERDQDYSEDSEEAYQVAED